MVTVDELHELVDALPEAKREAAARALEALTGTALVSGTVFFGGVPEPAIVRPDAPAIASIDELRGDFWPADEGPNDFLNAVHVWRRDRDDA